MGPSSSESSKCSEQFWGQELASASEGHVFEQTGRIQDTVTKDKCRKGTRPLQHVVRKGPQVP